MAKRLQQDSRQERVTAKSRPMMSSNVPSSTSVSPVKRSYGSQDPWCMNAAKEERPGRPVVGSDRKTVSDYYHEQFIESSSSASCSKWDDDHAWSSQEWKTDTEMYERSGRPDVTSWWATRESQPGFSHEETHHDGTAQSVVNEATPHEGSWWPVVIPQKETWPQQFVIGNDEAEIELSVESRRSFVNRVNDQVRKKTETNFKCYRRRRKTFFDLVNVYDCDDGISSIHEKELPEQLSIYREHNRSHTQTNKCSTYLQDWCLSKMRSQVGNNWLGESFVEILVIEWCRKSQRTKVNVFSDSVFCLGKILENLPIKRCMGTKIGVVQNYTGIQKLGQNRQRVDGIRVEHLPRI